jgi:uncharacterized protein
MALGRMLVPDDGDELALLETRYRLSRYDRGRFGLTLVTSLGCNFDCPYCFEAKHPSIMDEAVVAAVLQMVDDRLPRITELTVTWFGGEPLVGKVPLLALSDAFIERCDRAGVAYGATITTNGYLLDEQTCVELAQRRVRHAQVCLDGPPDVHDRMRPLLNGKGTLRRIVENLHHAVEHLTVAVRMNVDTENYPRAEELLQILAAEGLAGRLTVHLGQIVGVDDGAPSPSATYGGRCFTSKGFAEADLASPAWPTATGSAGRGWPGRWRRPARRCGPRSWWWGAGASCTSAGSRSATPASRSAPSGTTPTSSAGSSGG